MPRQRLVIHFSKNPTCSNAKYHECWEFVCVHAAQSVKEATAAAGDHAADSAQQTLVNGAKSGE
jgi:hypothetical protein